MAFSTAHSLIRSSIDHYGCNCDKNCDELLETLLDRLTETNKRQSSRTLEKWIVELDKVAQRNQTLLERSELLVQLREIRDSGAPTMQPLLDELNNLLSPLYAYYMRGTLSKALLVRIRDICLEMSPTSKDLNLESWPSIQRACEDEEFCTTYHRALETIGLNPLDISMQLLEGWMKAQCHPKLSLPPTSQELLAIVQGLGAPPSVELLCKSVYSLDSK